MKVSLPLGIGKPAHETTAVGTAATAMSVQLGTGYGMAGKLAALMATPFM